MARNALDAVLGRLGQDGEELELRGMLNFKTPLTLTESDNGYDVEIADAVLGAVTYLREQDVSGSYASSTEFINCRVAGAITVAGTATFRGCKAAGAYAITATAIETDNSSAYALQVAGCTVSVLPTDLEPSAPIYGWGTTGNLVSSSGLTGLGENYYNNVTLSGTAQIRTDRFILRVKNLLDLSAAPAAAITGAAQSVGGNASGATAGAAGTATSNGNGHFNGVVGALTGAAGATGTTGAGAAGTSVGTIRYTFGSNGGSAGASGAGSNAGVALQGGATITFPRVALDGVPLRAVGPASGGSAVADIQLFGSTPGRPGSSGGGSGSVAGGGGGGSAQGTSPIIIYARGIKRGVGTAAGVIAGQANPGGAGGNGAGANAGGGSGAGGSGGAGILIVYDWLIGTQVANAVTADGGAGGNGGDGGAGATGGNGGNGGDGGRITLFNRVTGVVTQVQGSGGTAGTAASGATHGNGGAGGTCAVAL